MCFRTDKFIQTTLQDKFRDCTIITVAHRLNTVMHCDKILVLANGIIKVSGLKNVLNFCYYSKLCNLGI